jgi:hypothetical protein
LEIKNFPTQDVQDLMHHFEKIGKFSRTRDQVFHVTISLPANEILDDKTFKEVAETYMQEMGYGEQAYAVYLHNDKQHQHIHIVSSRINQDTFKKIDDSNERIRSNKIREKLEIRYNLRPAKEQEQGVGEGLVQELDDILKKALTHNPYNLKVLQEHIAPSGVVVLQNSKGVSFVLNRAAADGVRERAINSSEIPCFMGKSLKTQLGKNYYSRKYNISKIKDVIDKILNPTLGQPIEWIPNFVTRMSKWGVTVNLHENAGGIYGVSFGYKGWEFKGSDLGEDYTWRSIAFRIGETKKHATTVVEKPAITSHRHVPVKLNLGNAAYGSDDSTKKKKKKDEDAEEEEERRKGRSV